MREDLAALLSRVSSLQGVAVPAHRFVYQQQTESGIALEDMSVVDQVMAIWGARFPDGPIEKLNFDKLDKSSFPALWVSEDGEKIKLLRGKQNGKYICESSDWSVDSSSTHSTAVACTKSCLMDACQRCSQSLGAWLWVPCKHALLQLALAINTTFDCIGAYTPHQL